jgi:hypothetical protein
LLYSFWQRFDTFCQGDAVGDGPERSIKNRSWGTGGRAVGSEDHRVFARLREVEAAAAATGERAGPVGAKLRELVAAAGAELGVWIEEERAARPAVGVGTTTIELERGEFAIALGAEFGGRWGRVES